MDYETWQIVSGVVLFLGVVGPVGIYFGVRSRKDDSGKRLFGKLLAGTFAFVGFLAVAVLYDFAIVRAYPEHQARHDRELEAVNVAQEPRYELVDGLVGRWRAHGSGGELQFTRSSYTVISPNGATTATWRFNTVEIYGNCTRVRPYHFSAAQRGQAPVEAAISNPGPGDDMDFCLTSDKRMLEMQPAVGDNRTLWRRVD